jgi:hypothetical protein
VTVELTALGTYFAEGLELEIMNRLSLHDGSDLLLHLFDKQDIGGHVLRCEAERALVQVGEQKWWLQKQSGGRRERWTVHAAERV